MSRRFKSSPVPPPDAAGSVEMRIAGTLHQVDWRLTGDRLTISSPAGHFHAAKRDVGKGSVEDQARGLVLELWEKLRAGRRG